MKSTGCMSIIGLLMMALFSGVSFQSLPELRQTTHTPSPSLADFKQTLAAIPPIIKDKSLDLKGKITFVSDRDGSNQIYVMNANGTNVVKITHDKVDKQSPSWSADGKYIAYVANIDGYGHIFRINADGSTPQQITSGFSNNFSPEWSPDGKQIAFESDLTLNKDIYVMDSDGSRITNLTNNPAEDRSPAWSPDGKQIVFYSARAAQSTDDNLYIMDVNGSHQTRITEHPALDAVWSPDGKHIAVVAYREEVNSAFIWLIEPDGSNGNPLLNSRPYDGIPEWSPDGKYLIITNFGSDTWRLFILSVDETKRLQLTNDGSNNWESDWTR